MTILEFNLKKSMIKCTKLTSKYSLRKIFLFIKNYYKQPKSFKKNKNIAFVDTKIVHNMYITHPTCCWIKQKEVKNLANIKKDTNLA